MRSIKNRPAHDFFLFVSSQSAAYFRFPNVSKRASYWYTVYIYCNAKCFDDILKIWGFFFSVLIFLIRLFTWPKVLYTEKGVNEEVGSVWLYTRRSYNYLNYIVVNENIPQCNKCKVYSKNDKVFQALEFGNLCPDNQMQEISFNLLHKSSNSPSPFVKLTTLKLEVAHIII